MSAQLGDRVRVTAGKHANRCGHVVFLEQEQAGVRLEPDRAFNPRLTWAAEGVLRFAIEDLQRVTS